jgi:diphthamide biosynthesis protein 2
MGKPSPAKLANFPEIEVFVLLADAQGAILDCREYLAPIVTPHEAWLAFTGRSLQPESYKLDFSDLLRADCSSDSGDEDELRGGGGSSSAISGSRRNDTKTSDIGGNVNDNVSGSSDGGNDSSGDNNIKEQATVGLSALVLAGSGGGASGGGSSTRALTGSSSRTGAQLSVRSAAQYLAEARSYRGLETPATGAELLPPSIAVEGRSGRAAGYTDEPPPAR